MNYINQSTFKRNKIHASFDILNYLIFYSQIHFLVLTNFAGNMSKGKCTANKCIKQAFNLQLS